MFLKFILILTLISIFFYFIYLSNSNIEISRFEIKIKENLNNFKNFKIVQISDLQNNNFYGKLESLIDKEKPDLIFITGDLIDCYNTNMEVAISLVLNLSKKYKIFYVSGNHEARVKNYLKFEEKLINLGVVVLNNLSFDYEISTQKIKILGLKDPLFTSRKKQGEIVKNSFKNLQIGDFNILLTHRPEHFDIYVNNKIDLVFSGHAHGGQIQIPFTNRGIIAPNQGIFPKFTNGLYEKNKTKMIVSRGLGNSKGRLRFNNPYNLVVVKLI